MNPVLIGYFPKKTTRKPDCLNAPSVELIGSASTCISEGPVNWIDLWKHNDFFLFNSVETALSVLNNESDKDTYDVYAYKRFPIRIENGESADEEILVLNIEPLDKRFRFWGYDAVSVFAGSGFECSPLSCNGGAEIMKVNKYCLFDTFDEALSGAREFSKGEWEPGPYWIVEVYRLEGN